MSIFKKESGSNRPQPYSVGPLNMVPMKWRQYENLTEEEKNNGTMYHITDKSYDKPDASDIPYDGETSGSEETNVQDELDKLESVTDQLNTDLSELVATGIGATCGAQLTSLQSAYNALPLKKKERAILVVEDDGIYQNTRAGYGRFVKIVTNVSAKAIYTNYLYIDNATAGEVSIVNGTTTARDATSDATTKIELWA